MTKERPDRAKPARPLRHDPAKVIRRRYDLGRSQADVGSASGVGAPHLSEIENGLRNPTAPTLARIAAELGCKASDLMPDMPQAGTRR
jgi:transcriptional regulator with XRE-family HTH domain